MASGPITSWQIDGETMETVRETLFWGGSKVTADSDRSREIKRYLLLGRKAMIKHHIKSRDITLPSNVHIVKAMVFPVDMYSCDQFSSVSVVSDSLRPHESQHARPPCPSPTPGVHSDSCPSSW